MARLRPVLDGCGLFDAGWYLLRYPDVASAGLDPSLHYLGFGMAEGRWPNRYFDPRWYVSTYPDVTDAGLPPLLHYAWHGEAAGRRPHPHFDPTWYRLVYAVPPERSALGHFLRQRESGTFAPCAELYWVPMLPHDGTVPAAGDPFARYLDEMERTGRADLPDVAILAEGGLFDANHYLINGFDVHEAALDPLVHYCRFGWKEGRRPNIYFDAAWYVATNPGLARLRVNPLAHYVLEGEADNRRPVPYFDPKWYRERYGLTAQQNALGHFLANRFSQLVSPNALFDVRWYVAQHSEVASRTCDPFMHYLQASTLRDSDPSPRFDAGGYRRRHLGRVTRAFGHLVRLERDNPLVHHLTAEYLAMCSD
jgi:hypothetical protein